MSDETTAAKTVNWTINKAAGSLSVSPQTVTLDMEHPTAQITVTRPVSYTHLDVYKRQVLSILYMQSGSGEFSCDVRV